MSTSGFILRRLALSGPGRDTASVEFERGLNVVSGPSDTGKTFIAQCIDFMLGGSRPPKRIPEVEGYDTVLLDIEAVDGERLSLRRSLSGGAFELTRAGETVILKEAHEAGNDETVSHLLLSMTGLVGKKVRTNVRGATRTLSFRDVARLAIVGEEEVIAERSPVLSGQHISKTVESSVFRLLLTGSDDSSLVEQDEPKVARSKQQGKKELLEEFLAKSEQEIAEATKEEVSEDALAQSLHAAETAVQDASTALSAERESASALEQERKTAWSSLRQVQSRAAVAEELQRRFELLQEQYESDLRRLEAIGEAGVRLAQMTEERCPVCGAVAEHHDAEHRGAHAQPADVAAACSAERQKIEVLLRDLAVTLDNNRGELSRLEVEAATHRGQLKAAQERLREELQPRLSALVAGVREAEQRRAHLARLTDLLRRRKELATLLAEAEKPIPKATKLPSASVGADEAEEFSKAAEELLRAWNFPHLDRVTFSEDDQDLVISGRKRSSHGKGVRALTHAAFSLALLRYCIEHDRPHPGFVVIDSPLVVYREPDTSEGGEEYHVKDTFYRGVASAFASNQIIVLENEEPPADLDGAHVVTFTGASHGRSGFLPRQDETPPGSP